MGPAVVDYRFKRLPSAFRYFPRAVFGQRSALVPDGQLVPRLEGAASNPCRKRPHLGAIARSAGSRTTAACRSPIRM